MPQKQSSPCKFEHLVKEVAKSAGADARTVWKFLAGGKVRPAVATRIDSSAHAARLSETGPMTPHSRRASAALAVSRRYRLGAKGRSP